MTFKSILKSTFFGPETALNFSLKVSEYPFFAWLKDGKKRAADIRTGTKKGKRVLQSPQKKQVVFYWLSNSYPIQTTVNDNKQFSTG